MATMMRRLFALLLFLFSVGAAAGSCGEKENLHCCMMEHLCEACQCSDAEWRVASSKNEAACEELIDAHNYGCTIKTDTGSSYNETSAAADCAH
jgi:hypothetical protein